MEASRGSGVGLHTLVTGVVDDDDDDDDDEQLHHQTFNSLEIITPDIHRIGEPHNRSGPSRGEEFLPWPHQ